MVLKKTTLSKKIKNFTTRACENPIIKSPAISSTWVLLFGFLLVFLILAICGLLYLGQEVSSYSLELTELTSINKKLMLDVKELNDRLEAFEGSKKNGFLGWIKSLFVRKA